MIVHKKIRNIFDKSDRKILSGDSM